MGDVGSIGVHVWCAKEGGSRFDVRPLAGLAFALAALFVVVEGLVVAEGAVELNVLAFPVVAAVASVVVVVVSALVGVRVVVLVAGNHLHRRGRLGIGTYQMSCLELFLAALVVVVLAVASVVGAVGVAAMGGAAVLVAVSVVSKMVALVAMVAVAVAEVAAPAIFVALAALL